MSKQWMIYLFWMLLLPYTLPAQEVVNLRMLDEVYSALRQTAGVSADSVKYTGGDFSKAGGGFAWQRGDGKGWTTGCRLTVRGMEPEEVKKIRERFASLSSVQYVNLHHLNQASTYIDTIRTAYLYDYNPENKILYFLKATTTGEICVPAQWTTANYVDATSPFVHASETDLRLLGLSRLWAEVKRNFVFMDRVKPDWDSLYMANMLPVMQAKDRDECFRILQRMAAQLGDGHTYVYGSDPRSRAVPLTTVLIDNRVYVDEVKSSFFSKQGVRRGMELASINGEPAPDYGRREIMPYVSSSTPSGGYI